MQNDTAKKQVPFFSLIVPTYNRAHFIQKTLKSALTQEYKNFEIIVVDDGSTDNTEEVVAALISADDRIRYYIKENEERAAARNFGVLKARGNYITFLDSDDLLYPNHFLEAFRMVVHYHSPEIFHLGYEVRDDKGNKIRVYNKKRDIINNQLLKGNIMSCMGVFLRSDVAKRHLFNFNIQLTSAEDWELWLRVAARYNIYSSNVVTGCLIDHKGRSMAEADLKKALKINNTLQKSLEQDTIFMRRYGSKLPAVIGHMYTLLALRISKTMRRNALKYLLIGIYKSPAELLSKRTIAILRNIAFK